MLRANGKFKGLFFAVWACICSGHIAAEQDISVRSGTYEVFYSAFNTSFLSPEVAAAVGVVRAKDRGLINISIIQHLPDKTTQPVAASRIEGTTFDLIHRNKLVFSEVVEPGARYYLAPFKIQNNDEFIKIDVSVVPEHTDTPIDLSFKRQFFHN